MRQHCGKWGVVSRERARNSRETECGGKGSWKGRWSSEVCAGEGDRPRVAGSGERCANIGKRNVWRDMGADDWDGRTVRLSKEVGNVIVKTVL